MGRRRANATYFSSHGVDVATGMIYAMDLTPLVTDPGEGVSAYVQGFADRFVPDVMARLARFQEER